MILVQVIIVAFSAGLIKVFFGIYKEKKMIIKAKLRKCFKKNEEVRRMIRLQPLELERPTLINRGPQIVQ